MIYKLSMLIFTIYFVNCFHYVRDYFDIQGYLLLLIYVLRKCMTGDGKSDIIRLHVHILKEIYVQGKCSITAS